MPFLLPIALLSGTSIFAWKAGEATGNSIDKLAKAALIGGSIYLIYKARS